MPIIKDMDSLAGALAPAAVEWPVKLKLFNNNFLMGVEPETCALAEPYQTGDITIKDEAQLVRVLSNLEQLRAVNQWADDAGLFLIAPAKEAEDQPAPDPAPTHVAEAAPETQAATEPVADKPVQPAQPARRQRDRP